MEKRLQNYFKAEITTAVLLISIAAIILSIGALGIFNWKTPFWKGMGYPFVLLAFFELARTGSRYFQNSRQYKASMNLLRNFPNQFIRSELSRLQFADQTSLKNRKVEQYLLALGILMLLLGGIVFQNAFSLGLGVGLSIHAAITLIFEVISQWRTGLYKYEVESFRNTKNHL